jgi:hypothetical protein
VQQATVGGALGAGLRAALGEAWVAILGMALGLLRGALALPVAAFVLAGSWLAAQGVLSQGSTPERAMELVLQLWGTPRFRSIALGLWLSGVLLFGALRVAWLAGAAPVLAWRLSGGRGDRPSFSAGAAWRFHAVLPAAVLAFLLDAVGKGMVLGAVLGAVAVGARVQASGAPGAAAFVAACALASAAFLAASLSVIGDVTVARAAMAGEGPARAFRHGLRAFLGRPAAFVVAALAVWVATGFAVALAQGALTGFASVVRGAPRPLLLVPELLLGAVGALLAAGAELWRLSAVGVLALPRQSGRETRWISLRSESLGIRPPSQ